MKTVSQLKTELGITNNTTTAELIEIAVASEVFSQSEINKIKSISVLPLPTNVKNKEAELKKRFTDIVLNEDNGQLAIQNKRNVILVELIKKLSTEKQQALSVPIDSGLTMTDSYKLKVKGSESGGISVVPAGVKINYDTDEFQVIKNSANFSGVTYTTKVLKNDYYNNTSPINKKILDENIGAVNYKYKDNLTVTTSAGSYEGRTKYTYTFSGITAKKIKANYSHEWYGTDYSGTGYKYDTNFTPKYNLTFDSSETVCSQFLTLLVKKAIDREYMGNLDIDYRTNITLPSGEIAIFNPVAKVGDIVYFSCPNLVCTMTPTNTTPQILSIVLGLKESGDNYIVEFDVDDVTEHPATISNNTTVHCLTGMVYDAYVSEDDLGVGYKYITLKTSSATSNVKKLIEIDFAPTADSEHLVFSGGVKSAIDNLETALNADIEASGHTIELALDSTNYKITAVLKDANGNTISTSTAIDLPLESVVVSGAYDDTTKKVVLTLQNGSTIEFSVADLVSGLQAEITSANKLDADLVDDTNSTHKFVSPSEKQDISNLKNGTDTTNVITITKTYNQTAAEYTSGLSEVDISGYVTQSDYNKLNINTTIYISLEFTDIKMKYILKPSSYTVDASDNTVQSWVFRTDSGSAVDVYGMYEMYGFIQYDRAYDFTLKAVQVYTEAEVNALLDAQFLTDSEMTTLLSEVFD